jgi:hypothetical protein
MATMIGLPSASVHSWTKIRLPGVNVRASAAASSRSFTLNRLRWFMFPPVNDQPTTEQASTKACTNRNRAMSVNEKNYDALEETFCHLGDRFVFFHAIPVHDWTTQKKIRGRF